MPEKTIEQMASEFKKQMEEHTNSVKEIAEKALAEAERGINMSESQKEKADEALTKLNEKMQASFDELDQKIAAGSHGDVGGGEKSLGQQFIENDSVKSWVDGKPKRGAISMDVKAPLTSGTSGAQGDVGALGQPTRLPGIQGLPQMPLMVADLLMPGQMDSGSLEYIVEKGFNNNAAMVKEHDKKPESDITLEHKTEGAKVIAHFMKVPKQVLEDIPQLRSHIDARLLFGLALKKDEQILYGDGVGQNLKGLVPQATAFNPGAVSEELSIIDIFRYAMLQAVLAEFPADGHVVNPIDWAKIETLKDTIGRHIIGSPQGSATKTLWGLPVAEVSKMNAGKFLTGSFRFGAQYFDRWESRVEVGFENDDFTRNRVTILAEERGALAAYRPESFITGDVTKVPAAA